MTRIQARWIVPMIAVLLIGSSRMSLAQDQDTGKKAGEKFDDAVQDIRKGFRRAGDGARDQFAKAKVSVQNMSVESRVYGRIHWDKALNDASIDLAMSEEGVITLTGFVANTKAKVHAVELAKDTVGVTKVVDQLTVKPVPVVTPAGNP